MESFLNRYRNITVLFLVLFAQLVLLAVQVKNDQDVRMIRVWTVTAVTPVARIVEFVRGNTIGLLRNYILMRDTHAENQRLKTERDQLKLENIFLKNQLNTADRAQALLTLQAHTPSKTLAGSVIGVGAGSSSRVVFVDRGSTEGVERGMAVVSPDGIIGKVIASYPTASEVLLITDPDFAAGVISQKNQVRGTLKGQGSPQCLLDYVPGEQKVEVGDWFYTSGDDRIFPRGFPVGKVTAVRPGQPFQQILIEPAGLKRVVEDVLILIQGVHQAIPEVPVQSPAMYIAPPPPGVQQEAAADQERSVTTEADRLRAKYKAIGDAQGHTFGEGLPGSKPPDFNVKLPNGTALGSPGAPASNIPAAPQGAAKPPAAFGGTNPISGNPPGTNAAGAVRIPPPTRPEASPAPAPPKPRVIPPAPVPAPPPSTGTVPGGTNPISRPGEDPSGSPVTPGRTPPRAPAPKPAQTGSSAPPAGSANRTSEPAPPTGQDPGTTPPAQAGPRE
jgi:rod shape-determining protein MreC